MARVSTPKWSHFRMLCAAGETTAVKSFVEDTTVHAPKPDESYGSYHTSEYHASLNRRWTNLEYGAVEAALNGRRETLVVLFDHGVNNFHASLLAACRGGHEHVAELVLEKGGANVDAAYRVACEHGQAALVALMLKHGVKDPGMGLYVAGYYDQQEIAELLVDKGVTAVDHGLYGACDGGSERLAKFMIKHGAKSFSTGLKVACDARRWVVAKLMIRHGATCTRQVFKRQTRSSQLLLLMNLPTKEVATLIDSRTQVIQFLLAGIPQLRFEHVPNIQSIVQHAKNMDQYKRSLNFLD